LEISKTTDYTIAMEFSKKLLRDRIIVFTLQLILFTSGFSCRLEEGKDELPCFDCGSNFIAIDYEAAWSPDGQWIAYFHEDTRPGYSGIYRIRPDGSENSLWLPGAQNPAWSPDSEWLAYSRNAQIWIREVEGDSTVQLTFEGRNFSPDWENSTHYIAYRRSYSSPEIAAVQGIWLFNLKTMGHLQIFSGNIAPPVWYNENEILSYQGEIDSVLGYKFLKIDITSQRIEPVYYLLKNHPRYLKVSKKFNQILFTGFTVVSKFTSSIFLLNKNDKTKSLIVSNAYAADWSPDGRSIVYTNSNPENGRLHIMDLGTNDKRQLTFEHHFNP